MAKTPDWTPEEDALLIAGERDKLNRSCNAMKTRVLRLRSLGHVIDNGYHEWTAAEDALCLAKKPVPGRTAGACRRRRSFLRMKKGVRTRPAHQRWTPDEIALAIAGENVPTRSLLAIRRAREVLRSKGVALEPMKIKLDPPRKNPNWKRKSRAAVFTPKASEKEMAHPIVSLVWSATKDVPAAVRDIVRSEMSIALLEGSLSPADVPKMVKVFQRRAGETDYKTVSMDAVRGYGWTLHDRVAA